MANVETAVQTLKESAAASEGQNIADRAFAREVDSLLNTFYADITELKRIELRSLFDLFLLKALYVDRRSTSIAALDYLGDLMAPARTDGRYLPYSRPRSLLRQSP